MAKLVAWGALMSLAACGGGAPKGALSPTAQSHDPGVVVPIEKMSWAIQTPGLPIQRVTLWGDPDHGGPFGELVKLPGGFESGLHAHTGDYQGVLVSGTWIHVAADGSGADRALLPGSYVLQPGKAMHIDKCKQGAECVLFLYQTEKPDILWPPPRTGGQ